MAGIIIPASGRFARYGNFNSSELVRLIDITSTGASIRIEKNSGVLLVEEGYSPGNPPGSYERIYFWFTSSQTASTTTRLSCYLVDGNVAVGTSIDRIKEIAIKKDIAPTVEGQGSYYDVTFDDLSIPFKYTYSTSPISIYIENPNSSVITITLNGNYSSNRLNIDTRGDDTAPTYNVTGPIDQTFEFNDTVNFAWTRGSMPSESTEITTWIEYSKNNGGNWTTLKRDTGIPTGYSTSAGAFGVGAVLWRVRGSTYFSNGWGTMSGGNFTVKAPLSYATPYVPKDGKYCNEKNEIKFQWYPTDASGYIPNKYDIQWKEESGQWTDLLSVTDGKQNCIVPANTLPNGIIYWRVRAYNRDDIAGDWSEPVNFTTIDGETTAYVSGPKNNAPVNETQQISFTWSTRNPYNNPQNGALLEYKEDGGTWSTLATISDSTKRYDAPVNFFQGAKNYTWRVTAYNTDDVPGTSSEGTFNTIASLLSAYAQTPENTIEDGDDPILFEWSVYGSAYGADLQYSRNNSTWIDFGPSVESGPQIVGDTLEYEAPSNTFPAGVIYWRVRAYNRNLVAGSWSSVKSFVVRAAPRMQDIGVTAVPWATVNWKADDQQVYEIFIDGKSIGSYFGAVEQYQLPDYLPDGEHIVGVRVLGSFDLWSQINVTTVTIENSPESQLTLKARTDVDAELVWTGGAGDFFIYRDGLMIGHTNEHSFIDRTAVGVHDYLVVERLASGNYNASAVLTRTPSVNCQHIAALAGGEWIAIPHTLKSQSDPSYSESQEVEYNYLSGSDYPIASIGGHRTDSGTYSAVFLYTEQDEHKRFLALRGKPVIFKTADGEVMIGILHAWERKPKLSRNQQYYTAYTFSIQRIGWEDFIDDTV